MKLATAVIALSAAMASALPTALTQREPECMGNLLCCPEIKTPLDDTLHGTLGTLGVNAEELVGSVGLLCKEYDGQCAQPAQCCEQANVLDLDLVGLGCHDVFPFKQIENVDF